MSIEEDNHYEGIQNVAQFHAELEKLEGAMQQAGAVANRLDVDAINAKRWARADGSQASKTYDALTRQKLDE